MRQSIRLHPLEDRTTPAVTADLSAGTLTVTGDAAADEVALAFGADEIAVNGETFDAAEVNEIRIDAGDGDDTVEVTGTVDSAAFNADTGTLTVSGTDVTLTGVVRVDDRLALEDRAFNFGDGDDQFNITPLDDGRAQLAFGDLSYDYSHPTSVLDINTGDGADIFSVMILDGDDAPESVVLDLGAGEDTAEVTPAEGVAISVDGGDGENDCVIAQVPTGTAEFDGDGQFVFSDFAPIMTDNVEIQSSRLAEGIERPQTPVPEEDFAVDANELGQFATANGQTVSVFNGAVAASATRPFTDAEAPGGVRVTTADVNGDGTADTVAATGPGSPGLVRVIDGATGDELMTLTAFEGQFTGGLLVTAADFNSDGRADIVVTPDDGGAARVTVFDGATGDVLANFFGIDDPNFRGGARPTAGDVDGDGRTDLIIAAGTGGGPRVAVYDGRFVATRPFGGDATAPLGFVPTVFGSVLAPPKLVDDFFAFEESQRDGAFVTAGDFNGDGLAEVVAGGGPGGAPRVTGFDGASLIAGEVSEVFNFFAGDADGRDGAQLAAKEDADGDCSLVVSTADGVMVFDGDALADGAVPTARPVAAPGGVFVG